LVTVIEKNVTAMIGDLELPSFAASNERFPPGLLYNNNGEQPCTPLV